MAQTKTISAYKVTAFDSKAAVEGGLCVMVPANYSIPASPNNTINTTGSGSTNFKGAGICRFVKPDKFLFTVDSVVYTFNSEGKAAALNSVGMKLLMGEVTETLASAGARVTRGSSNYAINSLSARDEFAIQALRGLLRTIEDPASLSDTEKRYYCDVAYQWAANMMQSAAYTRNDSLEGNNPSVPDTEGIVGALATVASAIGNISINSSSSSGNTDLTDVISALGELGFDSDASLNVGGDALNDISTALAPLPDVIELATGAEHTSYMNVYENNENRVLKNDTDDNDNVVPLKVDQIPWEYLGRFNLSTGSYGVIPEYHFTIPCLTHNQYVKVELYNSNDIKQDNNILCDYQRITEYCDENLDLVTEAEETGLHPSISLGAVGYISIADRPETNYIALTRAGSQHFESGDYLKIYVCGNVGSGVSSVTPGTGEVNIGSSGRGGSSSNPFYVSMPNYLPSDGTAERAKGLKNGDDEIVYINPPSYHDFNGDSGMYSWYTGTSGKDYYKAVLKWICTAWDRRSEYANRNVTFFMKCNPNALNFAILTIYNLSIVYDNSNQSTEPEKIGAVGLPQYSFGMAITLGNGLSFSLFGTTELNGETGNEAGFDYYFNNGYVWNAQTAGTAAATTDSTVIRNTGSATNLLKANGDTIALTNFIQGDRIKELCEVLNRCFEQANIDIVVGYRKPTQDTFALLPAASASGIHRIGTGVTYVTTNTAAAYIGYIEGVFGSGSAGITNPLVIIIDNGIKLLGKSADGSSLYYFDQGNIVGTNSAINMSSLVNSILNSAVTKLNKIGINVQNNGVLVLGSGMNTATISYYIPAFL